MNKRLRFERRSSLVRRHQTTCVRMQRSWIGVHRPSRAVPRRRTPRHGHHSKRDAVYDGSNAGDIRMVDVIHRLPFQNQPVKSARNHG